MCCTLLYCCNAFLCVGIGATVNIISNPAGTPVSGSINKFDYPIFSSVTLTCMVDPSPSTPVTYQWDTTCFTNDIHDTPTCFPTGQTTQNVTGNNLLAEDAGTISCTVIIGGNDYTTSRPLTLQISGTHVVEQFAVYMVYLWYSCAFNKGSKNLLPPGIMYLHS